MTREEILAMQAGRDIDALIEKYIFERTVTSDNRASYIKLPNGYSGLRSNKEWSADISAAWEVVQEMNAKNFWFGCQVLSSTCEAWFSLDGNTHKAMAKTFDLPLAICRAALLVVMEVEG